MDYRYYPHLDVGCAWFNDCYSGSRAARIGHFKDGAYYYAMWLPHPAISKNFAMIFGHELGHILTAHLYSHSEVEYNPISGSGKKLIEFETLAWNIAKSFVKPKFWNDARALDSLNTYLHPGEDRITELHEINKGISLKKKKGG